MRRLIRLAILIVVVLPVVTLSLWTVVALNFTYSHGERAGVVQKFSRRGWVCKTWEGELAMVNYPGSMPEIFRFTVRDEAVAQQVLGALGQRVSLAYDEHRGLPTSCLGETSYFVTGTRAIAETPAVPR